MTEDEMANLVLYQGHLLQYETTKSGYPLPLSCSYLEMSRKYSCSVLSKLASVLGKGKNTQSKGNRDSFYLVSFFDASGQPIADRLLIILPGLHNTLQNICWVQCIPK